MLPFRLCGLNLFFLSLSCWISLFTPLQGIGKLGGIAIQFYRYAINTICHVLSHPEEIA
jgi:hypothetical protein